MPTLPPVTDARIAAQAQATAPLTHVLAHRPMGNSLTSLTQAAADLSRATGRLSCSAYELPSPFEAVRLVFASQAATDIWTIDGILVAPSASHGGSGSAIGGGIVPYDESLAANHALWSPASFNGGGVASTPFDSLPTNTTGDTTGGMLVITLVTSALTATAGTVLTFASSTGYAGTKPFNGMIVQSFGGGIPAGTTVQSSTTTTVTLSAALTADVLSGEAIFFSFVALTLTRAVAAPGGPITIRTIRTDWIPLNSLPRNDYAPALGMDVAGTGIPAGAKLTGFTPQTITISADPTATTAGPLAVTLSTTCTLAAATTALQLDIPCADLSKISTGQTITGTNIAAGTTVAFVGGGYFRLSKPPSAALASGAVLTFANVLYTYGTGSGIVIGQRTITVKSTANLPILLVRVAASATGSNTVSGPSYTNAALRTEAALTGIPAVMMTRATGAGDAVRVPSLVAQNTANGNAACPVAWIEYLSRAPGHTVAAVGDSQIAGLTSGATGSMSFARRAVAALSTRDRPVAFFNLGMSGQWFQNFGLAAGQALRDVPLSAMVVEALSRNSTRDTPGSYASRAWALMQLAREMRVSPILVSEGAWGIRRPNGFVVASDVTAATVVPIVNSAPFNLTAARASGTGIPNGTTATIATATPYQVTLSAAVTLAAGAVIYLNSAAVASTVTASTAITLSSPFPIYSGGLTYASWAGGTDTSVSGTQGATSLVAASAVTIAAGTVLSFYSRDPLYSERAEGHRRFRMAAKSPALLSWDYYKFLEDSADPGFYAEKYSTDGVHANDTGHAAAALAFLKTLKTALGR